MVVHYAGYVQNWGLVDFGSKEEVENKYEIKL